MVSCPRHWRAGRRTGNSLESGLAQRWQRDADQRLAFHCARGKARHCGGGDARPDFKYQRNLNREARQEREEITKRLCWTSRSWRFKKEWLMIQLTTHLSSLADGLLEAGCIKFGDFTLKSGLQSPIYIDLRQIITYPKLLDQVGQAYLPILKGLQFSRIAGLPYAAIPIAAAISLAGNYPMIYPRKEVKTYGTKAEIEGLYQTGETVVVIDDLATTGGSKFEAIEKLTGAGLMVKDIVVLVDRQSGAKESLEQAGYSLHAVLTIGQLLEYWEETGKVEKDKIKETRMFLRQSSS